MHIVDGAVSLPPSWSVVGYLPSEAWRWVYALYRLSVYPKRGY
ncbi:MAG: hypothetical protein R3F37_16855 [Candidatus Competibacteraceae bacterium]